MHMYAVACVLRTLLPRYGQYAILILVDVYVGLRYAYYQIWAPKIHGACFL